MTKEKTPLKWKFETGAGVTSSTLDISLNTTDKNAVASPITNGFRITFVPSAELVEASYTWNVITNGSVAVDITDDVGNAPATIPPCLSITLIITDAGTYEYTVSVGSLSSPSI